MIIHCYVIDDESHAVDKLCKHIERTPGLELSGYDTNPLTALNDIAIKLPDVIFVDVDMPELNGLQVAELLAPGTIVVFTTAHPEYAVSAFEKNATDYLLKPFSYERFLKSIQKVRNNHSFPAKQADSGNKEFFVKTGTKGRLQRIAVEEILYIGGLLNYVEIFFKGHKVIAYLTFNEIAEQIGDDHFSRVHKSYIVNHHFIDSFDAVEIKLKDGRTLPIGRAYSAEFKSKLRSSILLSKRDH